MDQTSWNVNPGRQWLNEKRMGYRREQECVQVKQEIQLRQKARSIVDACYIGPSWYLGHRPIICDLLQNTQVGLATGTWQIDADRLWSCGHCLWCK